jgi:ABC-type enterochelin transport system permease subunit
VAAEKAINTGKANEMLTGLETDKTGDFSELSQGRYEWSRLVAALKRKDTSLLSE